MKIHYFLFLSLLLLTSCSDEPKELSILANPHGGVYALRIPDQLKVIKNSFYYDLEIKNLETGYKESKRFKLERMNFHPFTPTFAKDQLQYLHFEYFTFPQAIRAEAHNYLYNWDRKLKANKDMFSYTVTPTFALCQTQKIRPDKVVATLFTRLNKEVEFTKVYDDLTRFKNIQTPAYGAQSPC